MPVPHGLPEHRKWPMKQKLLLVSLTMKAILVVEFNQALRFFCYAAHNETLLNTIYKQFGVTCGSFTATCGGRTVGSGRL
jgi:hypothetical protein